MAEVLRKKPETQKDQLDELWDTVVGTNGKGVGTVAHENKVAIGEIKEDVAFIRGNIEGHISTEKPPPTRRTVTLRRVAETGVTALILFAFVAGLILLLGGKLTADDIVRILSAWKGTPQ